MRILVVEDDRLLNNLLVFHLMAANYTVDTVMTKAEAIKYAVSREYDLIILDVNLPDGSGFDICKEIKEYRRDTAVIFLTACDMESDQIKGFELGAEDYVTKPFPMSVFQKKVEALLARLTKQSGGECYDDDNLYIDFSEMTSVLAGNTVFFTPMEYLLLKIFVKNPKIVLTRQILLEKLWDIDSNFVNEHALTAAVSRVRSKIDCGELQYIKTVYGMGYMWIGGMKR